jgi:hypothetical protein
MTLSFIAAASAECVGAYEQIDELTRKTEGTLRAKVVRLEGVARRGGRQLSDIPRSYINRKMLAVAAPAGIIALSIKQSSEMCFTLLYPNCPSRIYAQMVHSPRITRSQRSWAPDEELCPAGVSVLRVAHDSDFVKPETMALLPVDGLTAEPHNQPRWQYQATVCFTPAVRS